MMIDEEITIDKYTSYYTSKSEVCGQKPPSKACEAFKVSE